jgi:hypothetical protein
MMRHGLLMWHRHRLMPLQQQREWVTLQQQYPQQQQQLLQVLLPSTLLACCWHPPSWREHQQQQHLVGRHLPCWQRQQAMLQGRGQRQQLLLLLLSLDPALPSSQQADA